MFTPSQRLSHQISVGIQLQTKINEAANIDGDYKKAALLAQCIAMTHTANHPQYLNHWNGWNLVMVKRDITTKAGTAFRAGDFAIAKVSFINQKQSYTLYSVRNFADTMLKPADVDTLQ